jgi:ElaB/YqjD/DUF883 family membrane-anchored ribosome-binding protein
MRILNKATVGAHGAVDQIADAAAPAAQWLEDKAETLASGKEKFLEATSKYIAAHPLQSLALAIAAGYLLSRLTR